MKIPLYLLTFFLPLFCSAQSVYHVQASSLAPFPDGLSWTSAFSDLQQALSIAQSGDSIWIAKGTYKPTLDNDRWKSFVLPSGVMLYGGFAGTETHFDQRDWEQNPTILSGDIGVSGDSTDNSYCIVYASNTGASTRIDGLIIENANADNTDINVPVGQLSRSGAGIYLNGSGQGAFAHLDIYNCILRRNRANYLGGGIFVNGRNGGQASVRLENTLFDSNRSGYLGAGLAVENNTNQVTPLNIVKCLFKSNYAVVEASAAWLYIHQAVTFSDCTFIRNKQPGPGSIKIEGDNFSQPVIFERCDFSENQSNDLGSAVYFRIYSASNQFYMRFRDCRFYANLSTPLYLYGPVGNYVLNVENSIFYHNSSGSSAGVAYWNPENPVHFSNCLFYKNHGSEFYGNAMYHVRNSIIVDEENDGKPYIATGNLSIDHCIVSQSSCAVLSYAITGGNNVDCGAGVIFAMDPAFVNPSLTTDADFHLLPCSPAINTGSNTVPDSFAIATDFDGALRIRYSVVDIGPYEANLLPKPPSVKNVSCAGESDGAVVFEPDLCVPFNIAWAGGLLIGNTLENLPSGTYLFTLTDANGANFSETVTISEPPPIKIIYSKFDASGPGNSDGSIRIDTVLGGTGNFIIPQDMDNLPPGTYTITVVDGNGCSASVSIEVGFTVGIHDAVGDVRSVFRPNPTPIGKPAFIDNITGSDGLLQVFDYQGNIIKKRPIDSEKTLQIEAGLPAGVYFISIYYSSGIHQVFKWIIQ